ncbi:MAG: hypothetical protein M0031_13955 [Thermaerobacter sp.]|nr:hypothetical protein [Thermaerobacter sp.]
MQEQVRGGEDIIFKQVSRLFRDELLANYGWEPMEITAEVPTALPFTVGERRPDFLFRLADGNLLHLEFQSTPARLERFLVYDALLLERDHCRVRTVVIYTGGLRAAESELDGGALLYRVHNFFLKDRNGESVREAAARKLAAGERLSRQETLDLILSPLMEQDCPPGDAVLAALRVAAAIPEQEAERDCCLGAIVGLGDKFLDDEQRRQLREVLYMTRVGELLREEGRAEGRAEGKAEGKAEAIRVLLTRRFGSVPGALSEELGRVREEPIWEELLLAAAGAASLAQFQRRLRELTGE